MLNNKARALHRLLTKRSRLGCLVEAVLEAVKDFRASHGEHLLNFI